MPSDEGLTSGSSEHEPSGRGKEFLRGCFLKRGTIVQAEDYHRAELKFTPRRELIGAVLQVDIGQEWTAEILVTGRPIRSKATNAVERFGFGAQHVDHLFAKVGGFEGISVRGDGHIAEEALTSLIGKEIYFIEFIRGVSERTGKPLYGRYRKVGALGRGPDWLTASFTEDVNEGFLSNYAPQFARGSKFALSGTGNDWPEEYTTQAPPSPYKEGAPHPAAAIGGGSQQYGPQSENSADPF